MRKVLGIFVGPYFPDQRWDENSVEKGIGGNETWALEVSKEFAKRGYEVILYAFPEVGHYVPGYESFYIAYYDELNTHIMEGKRFDYFIYVRHADKINPYLKCDNVYAMAPDVRYWDNWSKSVGAGRVKKWGCLSEWHKSNLMLRHGQYGMREDQIIRVTNGCSMEYYQDSYTYQDKKENYIVWSSGLYRGFFDMYENVLWPIIKDMDFNIHVCIGTPQDQKDLPEKAKILPKVIYHGTVSKKGLADLQKGAKAWIYPSQYPETFCITAVENGMSRNALICAPTYGLGSTLEGYNFPFESQLGEGNYKDWEEVLRRVLTDDIYRVELANSAYNVCRKYTWKYAADIWEEEFQHCDEMPGSLYLHSGGL